MSHTQLSYLVLRRRCGLPHCHCLRVSTYETTRQSPLTHATLSSSATSFLAIPDMARLLSPATSQKEGRYELLTLSWVNGPRSLQCLGGARPQGDVALS